MMVRNKRRRPGRARTEAAEAQKQLLIAPVVSLGDLLGKASTDPRYAQLALLAASNLGLSITTTDYGIANLTRAMQWLRTNAQETTAEGVVAEVNFCRDLVTETETEF